MYKAVHVQFISYRFQNQNNTQVEDICIVFADNDSVAGIVLPISAEQSIFNY